MLSVSRALLALTITALAVVGGLVALLLRQGVGDSTAIWISIASAAVSGLSLSIAVINLATGDARARFTNSFLIAKRWDEKPLLDAREALLPLLATPGDIKARASEPQFSRALVHFANFYWDMAAAIETRWADPGYLRLRFRATLETLYPAFEAQAESSPDRAAKDAIEAIRALREKWRAWPKSLG